MNCRFAGHGSGLQHILFRKIMKKKIKTVMFLFGCDSVRLHSTGLYSEMLGPHMYFLAAKWYNLMFVIIIQILFFISVVFYFFLVLL